MIRYLTIVGCVITSAAAFAVDAPYSDNFDSYANGSSPNNFVTQTTGGGVVWGAGWNVQNPSGTAGAYSSSIFGDFANSSSAMSIANLSQTDFMLTTTFVVNSFSAQPGSLHIIRVGLGALGSASGFANSGYALTYEILSSGAAEPPAGSLALFSSQGGGVSNTNLPVSLGTTYSMSLIGTYSGSGLLLTGTLSDGNNSISASSLMSNPEQGTQFGYYGFAAGQTNRAVSVNVSYDNFNIAVPEPQILSLLVITFAALGISRIKAKIGLQ